MELKLTDYYDPLPSQKKLHHSKAKFKLYLGGYGSGKSKWMAWEVILLCIEEPGHKAMIMRATYPELDASIYPDFLEWCPPEFIAQHKKTKRELIFKNGSTVQFKSFDAVRKMKSLNINTAAMDQAEESDIRFFLSLVSRIRRTVADQDKIKLKKDGTMDESTIGNRYFLLAANYRPGNWTVKMFMRDKKESPNFDYVIASTYENKWLPPDYVKSLEEIYPEDWITRYVRMDIGKLEQDADIRCFRYEKKHIIKRAEVPLIFDESVDQEKAKFMVVLDNGVSAPTAVLFIMVDLREYLEKEDGLAKAYLFDEIYERDLTIEKISYLIKTKLIKYKLWENPKKKVWRYLIDPASAGRSQGISENTQVITLYRRQGFPFVGAINDMRYGLLRVESLIDKGLIFVCEEMENYNLEQAAYVKDRPDSIDNISDPYAAPDLPKRGQRDHLMDDTRYGIAAMPIYWFSKELKKKDMVGRRILTERIRSKGKRSRQTINLAAMDRRKDYYANHKKIKKVAFKALR